MSKRKYSEVEMIGALKQLEAGRTAADVGRELGFPSSLEGAVRRMSVGETQRLRQLEDENQRLKKLVADLSLDKETLKAGSDPSRRSRLRALRRIVNPAS
jgi:putative transposase